MCAMRHVIVSGGIAAGKTTLLRGLGQQWPDAAVFPEAKGTLLSYFYQDKPGFGFMNQVDYMTQLIERIPMIRRHLGTVIEDRSIFDTHCVFSAMLRDAECMTEQQFRILSRLYDACRQLISPSYLVLLDCAPETSLRRLGLRNDIEERTVTLDYLSRLRQCYLLWYESFDVCDKTLVNTDEASPEEIVADVTFRLNAS